MKWSTRGERSRRTSLEALVAVLGLVAGVVGIAAVPAAATPRWSIVPSESPSGPPIGELSGVSCSSASDCFAVGGGLFEHWNGSAWSFVAGPTSAGSDTQLFGVSCTSPTTCFAVGGAATETRTTFSAKTLVERWDGTTWSTVPSPNPVGQSEAELDGVSCTSATDCFAVGDSSTAPIQLDANVFTGSPLIEHWDGSTWSIVASPSPGGSTEAELLGVSCVSAMSCYAVGDFEAPALGGALLEHWDGGSWSIAANPDARVAMRAGARPCGLSNFEQLVANDEHFASAVAPRQIGGFTSSPGLEGVSCSSDMSCFAVGFSFSGALVEHWNGANWSSVTTPTPPSSEGADLAAVSCASAADCSAVGSEGAATTSGDVTEVESAPLQEHWNGTSWSIVAGPRSAPVDELAGVSCPSSTSCAAVGDSALIERWNGTNWSIAPFGSKTSQSQLDSVACAGANSCFAVGSSESNTSINVLIEHWNGTRWSIVASPTPSGSFEARLSGVSCASSTDCMAVGSFASPAALDTLVEHWNGQRWSIVASPSPASAQESQLTSVSCPSTKLCVAVGSALSETSAKSLVEQWNGKTWSTAKSPSPSGAVFVELVGVSCPSATDCTAVGTAESFQGTRTPGAHVLVEHWDGTSWAVVASPNPAGAPFAIMVSVSCSGASSCVGVGFDAKSELGANRILTEHWNGKTWTVVATPPLHGSNEAGLVGVACRSAGSCDAVGSSSTTTAASTLVEHWNGIAWSVVSSPTPGGADDAALNAVSCPSSTRCVAVGSYSAEGSTFTLAEVGS